LHDLDYNETMLILLLFFSLSAFSEDTESEKYCFANVAQRIQAKQKISAILVPSDVVTDDENCLVIQMRPHRRELIQRFVLASYPSSRISFSSADVRRDPCRLKVEKEKSQNENNSTIQLSNTPSINHTHSTAVGNETIEIETIKDFELSVDQSEIKGTCRYITPNRYEISLSVLKKAKPLIPTELPPGTIVVVNHPLPDQDTSTLHTQIQLSRGERINIGNVIKQLNNKDSDVNINPSLKLEENDKKAAEKVFLSIQ